MWGAEAKQTPSIEQRVCHWFGNWDIVCKLSLEKAVVSDKQSKKLLTGQYTDKESEGREMNLLKIIQLIRGQAGLRI